MVNDWQYLSLREAGVTLIDCLHKTPPSAKLGYPYIAIPQIKQGRINIEGARLISKEHFLEWNKKNKPESYDVILSRRCNPGETAFVPPGLECTLGQNLVLLRSNGNKIFQPYLRWAVQGPDWWEQIQTFLNVGAVFDSLKCADIPNFIIPVPPLPEQRAIAHILGTLDDKIELNRRMNQTLEAMAQALFKSWFVDFDPVRAKMEGRPTGLPKEIEDLFPDSFEDSELGEIPKGWKFGKLGDLIVQRVERINPGPETRNFPYIPIECITPKSIFLSQSLYGSEAKSSLIKFYSGDILFGAMRPYFHKVCIVPFDGITRTTAFILFPKKKEDQYFSLFLLFQEDTIEFATNHSEGSTIPYAKWIGSLETKKISIPPMSLRSIFQKTVASFIGKGMAQMEESISLSKIKNVLLSKLLSGEIRLAEFKEE